MSFIMATTITYLGINLLKECIWFAPRKSKGHKRRLRKWRERLCLWMWRKTVLSGNFLKEISPECSLEGLMLKLAIWCEEPTHWKRPWCWERLKVGGEGDDRGWDGWVASPTQWTWVWVSSGSWWWTGRPGMLQSMGSQRVGHDWATELKFCQDVIHFNLIYKFSVDEGSNIIAFPKDIGQTDVNIFMEGEILSNSQLEEKNRICGDLSLCP